MCLCQKSYSVNTLGCSVLIISSNIFLIKACYQALRQVFKFVLWCKKFYRIGPRVEKPLFKTIQWKKTHFFLNGPAKIFFQHWFALVWNPLKVTKQCGQIGSLPWFVKCLTNMPKLRERAFINDVTQVEEVVCHFCDAM